MDCSCFKYYLYKVLTFWPVETLSYFTFNWHPQIGEFFSIWAISPPTITPFQYFFLTYCMHNVSIKTHTHTHTCKQAHTPSHTHTLYTALHNCLMFSFSHNWATRTVSVYITKHWKSIYLQHVLTVLFLLNSWHLTLKANSFLLF